MNILSRTLDFLAYVVAGVPGSLGGEARMWRAMLCQREGMSSSILCSWTRAMGLGVLVWDLFCRFVVCLFAVCLFLVRR